MTVSVSRAQPFYCPYCGEEDFVPADHEPSAAPGDSGRVPSEVATPRTSAVHQGSAAPDNPGRVPSEVATLRTPGGDDGGYHCRSCDRRFAVRFLGLGPGDERS